MAQLEQEVIVEIAAIRQWFEKGVDEYLKIISAEASNSADAKSSPC